MMHFTYTAMFWTPQGHQLETIKVYARNINSGFRRATKIALRDLPKHWQLRELVFVSL